MNRNGKIFAGVIGVGVGFTAFAAAVLYDALLGREPIPQWKQKVFVSTAAESQPQPAGAKEWQYTVFALEPREADRYHASGVATIIYPGQVIEQRIWWGIADIGNKGATFTAFELGPVVPDAEAKERAAAFLKSSPYP